MWPFKLIYTMDHPDFIAFWGISIGLKRIKTKAYLIISKECLKPISLFIVVNMSLNMYGTQYGLSHHNKIIKDVEF